MPRVLFVLTTCLTISTLPLFAQSTDALLAADRAASEASQSLGLTAGLLGALAPQGAVLWPGAPVVAGAVQVRQLLSAQRVLDSLRTTWQPLAIEISGDGGFGVTWGVAAVTRDGSAT